MAPTNELTKRTMLLATLLIATAAQGQSPSPLQPAPQPPTVTKPNQLKQCEANQISLSVDPEGGNFDGMSHSGFLLVLRNISPAPCALPGFPSLIFSDNGHHPLDIVRETPPGMHPGPVVVPVPIAAGAELTSTMRWVSSNVFDENKGVCANPTILSITLDKAELVTPIQATLCGQPKATYSMTKLAPDPVYTPTPTPATAAGK